MLGSHHIVSSSESLSRDYGNLGNGSLGVGIQKLGSVADDSTVFLKSGCGYRNKDMYHKPEQFLEGNRAHQPE